MKNATRILSFLLILTIAVTMLFSCSKAPANEGGESEEGVKVDSIKIAGVDISEYKIVYAVPENSVLRLANSGVIKTEYNFNKIIANELAARINSYIGVTPEVVSNRAEATEHEILIGNTGRVLSNKHSDVKVYRYEIEVSGGNMSISGGAVGNTYHALDYLFEELEARAAENSNVDFEEGFTLNGTHRLTTIACIGDSITYGVGASDNTLLSWPSVLSRVLWQDCYVINYGNSGKTMRGDLNDAYNKTREYQNAIRNAQNVDIALIMLGTNDSNRDRSWNAIDDQSFNEGCTQIVENMYKKNEKIKFIIMNCPVYNGNENFGSEHVRELQAALVPALSAKGYDMGFYDMYTFTKNEVTVARFGDGLHPDNEGYAIIGEEMGRMLEEVIEEVRQK